MSTALEAASLIMIPNSYSDGLLASVKPNDGTGDFTFTRGSNLAATRVKADGYIEKGYENLLTYSNQFNNNWLQNRIDLTSGQSGYDGGSDAWKLESNNASTTYLSQGVAASGVQTTSLYAKAGTADYFAYYTSSGASAWFNLSNGSIGNTGSNIDTQIEDVGNGWYRCSMSYDASISYVRIYLTDNNGSFTSAVGSNIYIQDAQVNQGLAALPYVESGATKGKAGVLENTPRIDFTGGTPSLLLEPSRTNIIPQSEYLNSSLIVRSNDFEINTSDTTSPEGLNNSCKFDFPSGSHRYFGRNVGALNDATTSVFVKAGTHQYVQYVSSTTNTFTVNFDVANGISNVVGTLPSGATYDIEDYGNNWYRIWVSQDHIGTVPSVYWWISNGLNAPRAAIATSAGNMYFYGFQVESNATYPTSYIPTYGVSQTRAADVCSKTGISSLIGQTEGTIYWEIDFIDVGSYTSLLIRGINNGDRILIQRRGNNNYLETILEIGYVAQVNYTNGAAVLNGVHKIAFMYSQDNFKTYLDGVLVGSDTSGSTFTNQLNNIFINPNTSAVKTKQVLTFNQALSDSECIELTTV